MTSNSTHRPGTISVARHGSEPPPGTPSAHCGRLSDGTAGAVRAQLEAEGRPIGAYDLLMAGQALRRQLTLVVVGHFEFPGILLPVIPAQAGIHKGEEPLYRLDSRLRGNDRREGAERN